MSLTSGMAKLNLAILICFISETFPNRFLDAANICTNRLQLLLQHNESYTNEGGTSIQMTVLAIIIAVLHRLPSG